MPAGCPALAPADRFEIWLPEAAAIAGKSQTRAVLLSPQIGLLHTFRVHQLVLAKLQNQTVIQAQWQHADHQERAKNKPQNAHMARAQAFPQGPKRLSGGWHLHSQF